MAWRGVAWRGVAWRARGVAHGVGGVQDRVGNPNPHSLREGSKRGFLASPATATTLQPRMPLEAIAAAAANAAVLHTGFVAFGSAVATRRHAAAAIAANSASFLQFAIVVSPRSRTPAAPRCSVAAGNQKPTRRLCTSRAGQSRSAREFAPLPSLGRARIDARTAVSKSSPIDSEIECPRAPFKNRAAKMPTRSHVNLERDQWHF